MPKDKKVINELVEDKAKRDASYEYSKNSIEPKAEGAFKGAVASGLAARFIKSNKNKSLNWKAHAANLAAGTIGGAIIGKIYNDKKVDKAQKARLYLADRRKGGKYIKENRDIYKSSNFKSIEQQTNKIVSNPYSSAVEVAKDQQPKTKGLWDVIKDSAGGAALGGAFGLMTKGKMRPIAVKRGASIGGAGMIASDIVDDGTNTINNSGSRIGNIMGIGASFAASGAVEPAVNRLLGRYSKNDVEYIKELKRRQKNGIKGFFTNKKGIDTQGYEFLKGYSNRNKPLKSVFKGMGASTLKSAGKYGLGGIGFGVGIDYLLNNMKKNEIQKTASVMFTSNDILKVRDRNAKEVANKSILKDTLVEFGGAGAGYLAVSKLLGLNKKHKIAGALAGTTYLSGRAIGKLYDKFKAKEYLSKSKTEKLSILKKDVDEDTIKPLDMYKAVVLNSVVS